MSNTKPRDIREIAIEEANSHWDKTERQGWPVNIGMARWAIETSVSRSVLAERKRAEAELSALRAEVGRLRTDAAKIEKLVREWHNGYDEGYRKSTGATEPKSVLDALIELKEERADLDLALKSTVPQPSAETQQ